jgi:4-hydroxyphenylpyruvate dioxygenase-like putative hemolysin
MMTTEMEFDHIAFPVPDLQKYVSLFSRLGFRPEWKRERIGNRETSMKTVVMTRGRAKFALMEGIDGQGPKGNRILSQVTEYYRRFGIAPQHIALRCENIEAVVREWHRAGVRFLTEDRDHRPQILVDKNKEGTVLQCFTYPIAGSWFFEIKQIVQGRACLHAFQEFRDRNVKGLWASLDRTIKEGLLFKTDIYGKIVKKSRYTYPECAELLKKIFISRSYGFGFGGIDVVVCEAVKTTLLEMMKEKTLHIEAGHRYRYKEVI